MPIIPSSALNATYAPFLEDVYDRYQADPDSVDPSWASVFRLVDELSGVAQPTGSDERWIADALRRYGHQIAKTSPLLAPEDGALATLRERATVAALEVPPEASALYEQYCGALSVESAHVDDESVRACS
ncbi:hypothetical protein BZM26_00690 [Paraburkholderia strydomiana]|nr:hypothetical protein BZM26_00690 [Paraburkholderia strydomiana]